MISITYYYKFELYIDICSLPSDTGPCRASHTNYFHNSETGLCEEFTYGGCDGNANNFDTLASCQEECGSLGKEIREQ